MADKTKPIRFWQEITLILALKFFVLFIIWVVWFSAPEQDPLDEQTIASKILSQQFDKDHEHDALTRTR
jgi:hypothetical protein